MGQSLRAGARQMSTATEAEAKAQMQRWTYISYGMIALVGGYGAVQLTASHGHEHEHVPKYAYLKMRTKPFPWSASGCDLFDSECKELAAKAQQALN